MNKQNKGFALILIIGIILIVSVLAAGGVLVYQQSKVAKEGVKKTENNEQKPIEENKNEIKKDETAGWKIYTNSEYGFEFKYPADAKIETQKLTTLEDANYGLNVYIYPNFIANKDKRISASLEILIGDLPQQYVCYPDSSQGATQKVINGINFMAVPWQTMTGGKRVDQTNVWSLVRRLSVVNNECYQIEAVIEGDMGKNLSTQDINQEQSIFDQMISTFKFTK